METLAPSILDVRNSFLEQFKNEQLDTISKKLDQLFDVEKDPIKRIVILASRVETIRKRIDEIYKDESTKMKIEKPAVDKNNFSNKNTNTIVNNDEKETIAWIRVIMKESTEVNGVRFPEGIQIDVTEEDSKKLIESGKAAVIK